MPIFCWPHAMSIHKIQQYSLKPIHCFDKFKLILYMKVRNSTTQLTIISSISKIAFPLFPAQTTSNYSQMYLTKSTNKWGPRLSNYLPCVWVWLPQLSGGLRSNGCGVFPEATFIYHYYREILIWEILEFHKSLFRFRFFWKMMFAKRF